MTIRAALVLAAVGVVVVASGQSFKPVHAYAAGDSDAYVVKVDASASTGEIGITSDTSRTVKQVYGDGDADIETKITNLKLSIGGQPLSWKDPQPSTSRYNRFGMPVTAEGQSLGMSFTRFGTFFGDKELKVGETSAIEQIDEKNPNNHLKGTVKLLSLDDGRAKLEIVVDSFTEGADKPMHLEGVATVHAATCRLLSFEGTAKNLPSIKGVAITTAKFSMEHK
ncbi:MAG TPA: hypothetical protein VHE55_04450 [Fimbriimonadaceae bacterium]|nr:hypothetical protein [Fimbriimonadaceae bacterium]